MHEWHVTPDYIVEHWTDELFMLMVDALASRKERESEARQGHSRVVPASELFRMIGAKVDHGD